MGAAAVRGPPRESENFPAFLQFFDFRRSISRIFGVAEIPDKLGGGHQLMQELKALCRRIDNQGGYAR